MGEKAIQLKNGRWIHIPAGLSPEQERDFLADIDRKPEELEAECKELLRLDQEGRLIPFEQALREMGITPLSDGREA